MLVFMCLAAWWQGRRVAPKSAAAMITYVCCIFILGSIGNAAQMHLTEQAFVDNPNYPGGPGNYAILDGSVLSNVVTYGAYLVNAWFSDGLLVCIYDNSDSMANTRGHSFIDFLFCGLQDLCIIGL